jgi:glycosyltransferase involved in cell wall biosynthesis
MARVCMVALTKYQSDARVRREAEALVERGDDVDVICLRGADTGRTRSLRGVRLYEVWVPRYRGSSALSYVAQYSVFFVLAAIGVSWLHLRRRYDVVQAHTMPDFIVFTAILAKLLGAKVLLDVHDLVPELYESKFGLSESDRAIRLLMWIERKSVAFADRAIAVHEPQLDALVSHGNPREKFSVLLNAPDPTFFAQRIGHASGNSSFKLVYHGTIAPRHGLETAVRAVSRVRDEIAPIQFLVLGVGDGVPRVEQLVRELELDEIVLVQKAMVPLEKLLPLISDADLGVVPIHDDGFTKYMLPVKLLEYVALGIPVVCSETETIRAHFDDTMLAFFPPGDEEALARRLVELYGDADAREELAERASVFLDVHSWDAEKRRYYALIDELADAPRPSVASRNTGRS